MNLVDNYLSHNGYDYFGNAAEDTLVFFVHDEDVPLPALHSGNSNEAITNLSDATVIRMTGVLSNKSSAVNTQTHAGIYDENNGDRSTNFDVGQENEAPRIG